MASVSRVNRAYIGLVANSLVSCSGWVIITFLAIQIMSNKIIICHLPIYVYVLYEIPGSLLVY